MLFNRHKQEIPTADEALPGRPERPFALAPRHLVLDAPLVTDESNIPDGHQVALFGLGCFWGAEEVFWQMPGVWSTSVGYAGGTPGHTRDLFRRHHASALHCGRHPRRRLRDARIHLGILRHQFPAPRDTHLPSAQWRLHGRHFQQRPPGDDPSRAADGP